MNERIFELAELALEETHRVMGSTCLQEAFDDFYTEKFAELVVRECIEVCNGQATYDPQTLPYKPSKQFADAIKEHFGVEE